MRIQVRTSTGEDAGPACDVLHRSITQYCRDDHQGNAQALEAWLNNKTSERVRGWILSKDHHAITAVVNGIPAGFALSSKAGKVLLCYLVPEVRFTGVGKAMLAAIERQGRADGINVLRLESTRTARSFYLRNGFFECGQPVESFGMESYPMEKVLTGVVR